MTRNTINCKEFVLCTGTTTEPCTFENNTPGTFVQYMYTYSGDYEAVLGDETRRGTSKTFYDLEKYLGQPMNVTKLYSETFSWFSINPLHETWLFDSEFLPENTSTTVVSSDKRKYIICINGKLLCNGTELPSLKYAQVTPDKMVEIVVPEGSVGLVLTRR
jgi:hypothetical protein